MTYDTLDLYGKFEGSFSVVIAAGEKQAKPSAVTSLLRLLAPAAAASSE